MEIPVLIEPVNTSRYRVTTGQPLALTAEGATREEALEHLRQALQARLRTGAEIASLDVSTPGHPLMCFAGMFKDNPLFDAWQEAIADYRQQVDDEQQRP